MCESCGCTCAGPAGGRIYQSIGWQGSIGLIGFILVEDGSLVVEVIYIDWL